MSRGLGDVYKRQKIAKASDKVPKGAGEKVNLDPTESVNYLMEKFKEKHII